MAIPANLTTSTDSCWSLHVGLIGSARSGRCCVLDAAASAVLRSVHAVVPVLTFSTLTVGHDRSVYTTLFGWNSLQSEIVCDVYSIGFVDTCSHEEVLLFLDGSFVVHVLVRVGCLVFQDLDELVETSSNDGS